MLALGNKAGNNYLMKKLISAFLSLLILGAVVAGAAIGAALWWYNQPSSLAAETVMIIEPRTGFTRITEQLAEAGVIEQAELFRVIAALDGSYKAFKAGEYAFAAAISPKQVAQLLVSGKSITHAITIPEGKNSAEIMAILLADTRLSGTIKEDIPEGSLLPDTHYVHRGDARQSVIERMRRAHSELLPTLWEARADNLPFSSINEALVLASIVEKETGIDGERAKVAGVFVNRLRLGMPLQSDPTTVYAIEFASKKPMQRALLRKDWEFVSPYNTYVTKGLPPAPICHAGRAAIEATLNPEAHDYLYFVATGKGGHYFAKNLAEHNQNVARYRAALRGGM